jgi:membrane-associated phospholipid phosphatase
VSSAWIAVVVLLLSFTTLAPVDALALDEGLDDTPPAPAAAAEEVEAGRLRRGAEWVADRATGAEPLRPVLSLRLPLVLGRQILWDTAYLLTAPARWDRCDWTRFSLLIASTGAWIGLDEPVDVFSREDHPRSNTEADIEDAIEKFAELPGIAGVIGGGLVYGTIAGDERAQAAAMRIGEALLLSEMLFVTPLKLMTGRERPREGNGPYHWGAGGRSLPSSHVASAFTLATGISEYADNNLWVAVPAYTLASGVAFARVRSNSHFLSDVFVGATIGVVVTKTTFWLEGQRRARHDNAHIPVHVVPFAERDVRGIALVVRF